MSTRYYQYIAAAAAWSRKHPGASIMEAHKAKRALARKLGLVA